MWGKWFGKSYCNEVLAPFRAQGRWSVLFEQEKAYAPTANALAAPLKELSAPGTGLKAEIVERDWRAHPAGIAVQENIGDAISRFRRYKQPTCPEEIPCRELSKASANFLRGSLKLNRGARRVICVWIELGRLGTQRQIAPLESLRRS
jgi:hypothetical protein